MNVVLIGFMCSGKSQVGRALAKKWNWNHVDTDEMITKDVGMSVADIIRKKGEPALREVERKAVQLVSLLDKTVISTGGGVPLDADNRSALEKNGIVVWLQVSPQTVLQRAGFAEKSSVDRSVASAGIHRETFGRTRTALCVGASCGRDRRSHVGKRGR